MTDSRYLLAADLDGTVIPLEETAKRRDEVAELARAIFRSREGVGSEEERLILAYVTGRHRKLALEGIEKFGLPEPDLLVCDVGTSVYLRGDGSFEPDPDYRALVREAFGGASGERIRGLLAGIPGLEPQEPEKQAEFKLSYYLPAGDASRTALAAVRRRLEEARAIVNLVWSHDSTSGRGLLDILPAGVAKDFAVRYLHDRTGVDEDHLVYAGDSGNDRAAMLTGYRVIVVANAPAELKAELREEAARAGIGERLYFARSPYAAGVLEGCRHFGLF